MEKKLYQLLKFATYYVKGKTKHDIHSPFVFQLVTQVLQNENTYYAFENIEKIRNSLLDSSETIPEYDLGAGSQMGGKKSRSLKNIVRRSSKSSKFGQLLFRLVNRFQPTHMIEIGTCAGIGTLYQAGAFSKSRFITLEGNPALAKIAKDNFQKLRLSNVELLEGPFDNTLPEAIGKLETLDYVFFDGNHTKEATLKYFNLCLPHANNDTLFIFDDIHWSSEMEEAWELIKNNEKVRITIDLFFMGLVFFRKEQAKEHFIIRY